MDFASQRCDQKPVSNGEMTIGGVHPSLCPLRTTHIDLLSRCWVKRLYALLPRRLQKGQWGYGTRLEEAHVLERGCSRSRKLVRG